LRGLRIALREAGLPPDLAGVESPLVSAWDDQGLPEKVQVVKASSAWRRGSSSNPNQDDAGQADRHPPEELLQAREPSSHPAARCRRAWHSNWVDAR